MPLALKLHPDSPCRAVRRIEVDIARSDADGVVLSYSVTGTMSDVLLPPVAPTARGDLLWQHTCFEAFVRPSPGDEYFEFNFAPSTQWAAYRFSGYRSGLCVAQEFDAPPIEVRSEPQSFTLRASLSLARLPHLARAASWQVGLSALIEDTSGRKSYWALAHPLGKPDFHHADSFALELSPAVSP